MISSGRRHPAAGEPQSATPDGRAAEEQPKWRRDFPIDWAQDEYVARREFVKFVLLTSAAFTAGQLWIAFESLTGAKPTLQRRRVAGINELAVGGAKTFYFPDRGSPRLLVRLGEDRFVAYDQRCTHLLCPVVPMVERGRLHCPCHNGWFDIETGRVVAGPPPRPLARVLLEIEDGSVYATGVEEAPA